MSRIRKDWVGLLPIVRESTCWTSGCRAGRRAPRNLKGLAASPRDLATTGTFRRRPITKTFIKALFRKYSQSVCRLSCRPRVFGDRVELGDKIRREFRRRSSEIFSKVANRRGAGDQQNVRRTLKEPGKRDLHWTRLHRCRDPIEHRRLQRCEPSQREKRHISNALLRESLDKGVVAAVCDVVEVLDTNDLRDSLSLLELPGGNVAETDVTNQSLMLQVDKHTQRFFDGSFRWCHDSAKSKVDDVERIGTKIPKIAMNAVDQLLTRKGLNPRFVRAAPGAHFGDDYQASRVGMKGLFDNLIGNMRAVIIAGVDMVHASGDRLLQNRNCSVNIPWRSPDFGAGQLHRAVAHSVEAGRGTRKSECATQLRLFGHFVFLPCAGQIR